MSESVVTEKGTTLTLDAPSGSKVQIEAAPPRKVCIVGFASARDQAPYNDPAWQMWGCNDVYAYVPRIDITFELHSLHNLVEGGRRNPKHLEVIASGVRPTVLLDDVIKRNPHFKNVQSFPKAEVDALFGRSYYTSSIALMLALAVAECTETHKLPDGREFRLAKAGAEIALFGVDMAAKSEFYAQRPCVEYYIGVADAAGIPVFIHPGSDICKSSGTYGYDTTLPLREKMEVKIAETMKATQSADQNLMNLQLQKENLLYQKGVADGARQALKSLRDTWTNPHEVVKAAEAGKDRHGEAMPLTNINPPSDNAGAIHG